MNTSTLKRALASSAIGLGVVASGTASAGGISLYEVGTADVGLASAGYSARAQDASTVFTNPAGMTRLSGDEVTLGTQMLYGDVGFSIGQGTTPALGSQSGGNPVGSMPGGGLFYSHSVSPDFKIGMAVTGNFGSVVEYDKGWVGRYRAQEGTLLGVSFLPSAAWRVNQNFSVGVSLNAMYGIFDTKVAVNNIIGPDGKLSLDDNAWGLGANVGLLYEVNSGTRFGLTYTSPVKLNFASKAKFTDLGTVVQALLGSRGLLDAKVDLGVTVPQGVNASFYHEIDPRLAILGSVGWQQWSKFGEVDVGVDSNNPIGLTTKLDFKDTWSGAGGAQYKLSDGWMLNGGIAYDSGFQDSNAVALALPVNAAWRFGIGGQRQQSQSFDWGVSFEYLYGGSLNTNIAGSVPVALGGRGNVVGSYNNNEFFFLAANFNWKF
jgi:long-chain fatty acid transport protein